MKEIGEFGWGLYSDDLRGPFHLVGRDAVSAETRAVAKSCDLFLRTDLEYQWPPFPENGLLESLSVLGVRGLAIFAVCPVAVFAAMLIPVALSNNAWWGAISIALFATLAVALGVLVHRWLGQREERRRAAYWSCGPKEIWPFFSKADYLCASNVDDAGKGSSLKSREELS